MCTTQLLACSPACAIRRRANLRFASSRIHTQTSARARYARALFCGRSGARSELSEAHIARRAPTAYSRMRGVGGRKTKVGVSATAVHGGVLLVQEHQVVPLAAHEDHLWAVRRRSECEAPRADARGRPRASALGAGHQGVSTAGPGRCGPSGGGRATASWGGPPARASSAAGGQLGSACGICIGAHAARRFMGRGVTRAGRTKWREGVKLM